MSKKVQSRLLAAAKARNMANLITVIECECIDDLSLVVLRQALRDADALGQAAENGDKDLAGKSIHTAIIDLQFIIDDATSNIF